MVRARNQQVDLLGVKTSYSRTLYPVKNFLVSLDLEHINCFLFAIFLDVRWSIESVMVRDRCGQCEASMPFPPIAYPVPISIPVPFTGAHPNVFGIQLGYSYKVCVFKKSVHRL